MLFLGPKKSWGIVLSLSGEEIGGRKREMCKEREDGIQRKRSYSRSGVKRKREDDHVYPIIKPPFCVYGL